MRRLRLPVDDDAAQIEDNGAHDIHTQLIEERAMIITTTPQIDGHPIRNTPGVIAGEAIV